MGTSRLAARWSIRPALFLLGAGIVFPPPATAQDQTLTGWFSFIVADYPSESGLASETTYTLTEDSGERHELLIDIALMQPLGGPVALNRKRVTVVGEWEPGEPDVPAQFRVHSIELVAPPPTASSGRTFASVSSSRTAVTGSQAWVTILCRFGDATNVTPRPVSWYEELMGSSYGLGHYWEEVSYENIPDLSGSAVVGWYNLPQPRSYYVYTHHERFDGAEDFRTDRAVEDCTAVADAEVFFPDFDGINLIFNHSDTNNAVSRGGSKRLTLDRQTQFYGVTWIHPAHDETHPHSVLAHEMGHAFGLPHSSGPYDEAYDSRWDVMSGGGSCRLPDPEYGCVSVHTIAYHKDFLGWIPPDRKYVAPHNSTRTITLERLAQPGSDGYLLAQIPIGDSTTDFYTVETRLFAGYDDEIPDEAVVIHKADTTREDRLAQVVDIDNNGDPNDEGAMWTVGEIFTDLENNLQVSIDAAWSTSYRVTINTNPATFRTCIDFLASSSHLLGPSRGTASVQAEAADDCEWSARSNTEWIRVASGASSSGSGQISYTVTRNPRSTARTGTLTIGGWTFTVTQAGVNGDLFEDDMENGANGWEGFTCGPDGCSRESLWALTTASSRSGAYAWTDSPSGNYQNDLNVFLQSPIIDLTRVKSATLVFWHRFDIASGGDGGIVYVNWGDSEWTEIRRFTGTNLTWQQTSIDLTPFGGQSIRLTFQLYADATGTAAGWYIDDVAVYSSDFETPGRTQGVLENPQPHSFQSGIAAISGWACEANEIVIELNGIPLQAGYGTIREDTRSVCGDADNGFSLLWNWNNLGPGEHTVRALLDGVEFADTTVRVTTFGEEVLRGASGRFDLPDFPASGETTVVRWEESLQNFVITDGQPNTGGGYNRVAGVSARLENPSLGSSQSGIGVISGWACEAEEIVIELDGIPLRAAYGTAREDTRSVCGDTNNGFSLLWNWNNLGAGTHTVRALLDGVEFADTTVRVTTFGETFLQEVSGTYPLSDFPRAGDMIRVRWEEALQNFVIMP